MKREYKATTLRKLQFKQGEEEGHVTAVVSTLDVIDRDQDITLHGAFQEGQPVRIASWGHKWHELPVGKGTIRESGNEAVFEGQFFLDTTPGMDTYKTVKNLGELQEWSYGFDILKSSFGERDGQQVRFLESLNVFEVSPVLLGSGLDTRTESIKQRSDLPYADEADAVLAAVEALKDRSKSLADLRAKEGRVLSDANRRRLQSLHGQLTAVAKDIAELLEATAPAEDDEKTATANRLRLLRMLRHREHLLLEA